HPGGGALTRPADLTELSGGIALAQYDAIRRLPGVQVAAPLTMVGYIPLTVSFQASVPAVVQNMARPVFVLSALHCASNGLSTLTQRTIGSGYAIRDLNGKQSRATGRLGGRRPRPPNVTVSIPVSWTFLLPLVAVDPAAEASLLHLHRAMIHGSYLTSGVSPRFGSIPVIMASSINDGERCAIAATQVPTSAARMYIRGRTTRQLANLLARRGSATGGASAGAKITAPRAYPALLHSCGGQVPKPVPAYMTTTEPRYQPSAAGVLMPLEVRNSASQIPAGPYLRTATPAVSAATQGIAFQKLVLHVAEHAGASPRRSAWAALVA